MGWLRLSNRDKPCRCRKPRIKRTHGDGSQWRCDNCHQTWELHRCDREAHWNRYGHFCDECGPTRPYMVEGQWYGGFSTEPPCVPDFQGTVRQPLDLSWIQTETISGSGKRSGPHPLDPPRQTGTDWLTTTLE